MVETLGKTCRKHRSRVDAKEQHDKTNGAEWMRSPFSHRITTVISQPHQIFYKKAPPAVPLKVLLLIKKEGAIGDYSD